MPTVAVRPKPAIPGVPSAPIIPYITTDSAGKAASNVHYGWVHRQGRRWGTEAFRRIGTSGLGVMAPQLCTWAQSATPEDAQAQYLYLVPAMPTIVEKSQLEPGAGLVNGAGAGDGGLLDTAGGTVCAINRWVDDNPLLAAGALVLGFFLLRKRRA